MDIFEYAMRMEKDGESYYRMLAQNTDHKGVKSIFTMLADEEVKHFSVLKYMQSRTPQQMVESTILNDTKNIFIQIQQSQEKLNFDVKQAEFYKKARDIEEKSRKFYLEKANDVSGEHKGIFITLAEEERKHYLLLENLLQFVSRPETWLENAEFYHQEEY